MKTTVTFKNIDPSDALKDYVTNKLRRFDKQFDSPAEATVVLSVEKLRHIADIRIVSGRMNLQITDETENMYAAIDFVMDKLKKKIKRTKEKTRERRPVSKEGIRGTAPVPPSDAEKEENEFSQADSGASIQPDPSVIIEEIDFKPMDAQEAALQLDLSGQSFLVYTDAKTEKVNVLYHRKDGALGLIRPST